MCRLCNDFNKELNEAVERQAEKMKTFTKEEAKEFLYGVGILDKKGNLLDKYKSDDD